MRVRGSASFVLSAGLLVGCGIDAVDESTVESAVAGGVDLVEMTVGDPPATAVNGSSFMVSDTVLNNGDTAGGASTTKYYLSLNGTQAAAGTFELGLRSVAGLGAGATDSGTATATIRAGTASGTYYLLACADKTLQVMEVNENNNCKASTGQVVVSAPDLTESNVSASPPVVDINGSLTVMDTVNNNTMVAAGMSVTRWYLSTDNVKDANDGFVRSCTNGPIPGRNVAAIAAGGSDTGSAATSPLCIRDAAGLHAPAAGTYFVIACADESQLVAESIENNQCAVAASSIQVVACGNGTIETGEMCDDSNTNNGDGCSSTCQNEGPADLVETAVSNPPTAGALGDSFMVTDTTANNGSQMAGASTVRYFLSTDNFKSPVDPAMTGGRAVGALAAMGTSSGSTTVTIPSSGVNAGTYHVLACADGDGVVTEASEANNCISSTGTITISGPDLTVTVIGNPPATSSVGGTFQVSDTTSNIGMGAAGGSTTKYYLSSNGTTVAGNTFVVATRTVGALAAGGNDSGTATGSIKTGTATGTYFLLACADRGPNLGPSSEVAETNENNNCKASATQVTISATDLTEQNVSVAQTTIVSGASSTLDVTETVANISAIDAGTSITRFFLSTDNVKSSNDGYIRHCVTKPAPGRNVPALVASATSTGTTNIPACVLETNGTSTHPITPGTYFIIACADNGNTVGEFNENNNCVASGNSFTVTP